MVFDRLSESRRYESLHPLFQAAFEFLKTAEDLEPGRYELEGGAYVNIIAGETAPAEKGRYETHRRYIDIQCLLKGQTLLWWANINDLNPITEYDAESDCRFYQAQGQSIPVRSGDFYVLYPEDGHLPNSARGGCPAPFKVAVAKIPVEADPV